jgi:hypothetical protein
MDNLDVYIKLTSGRTYHMSVPGYETVHTVCEKVAVEEGVSPRCLRLKYTGKILKKEHSMSYLGVRPETILKVDVIQEKSLSIQVECPSDVTISLTIQNVSTLQEILERVLDKLGRSRHGSSIPVLKVSRYCCLPRS